MTMAETMATDIVSTPNPLYRYTMALVRRLRRVLSHR